MSVELSLCLQQNSLYFPSGKSKNQIPCVMVTLVQGSFIIYSLLSVFFCLCFCWLIDAAFLLVLETADESRWENKINMRGIMEHEGSSEKTSTSVKQQYFTINYHTQ